MLGFLIRESMPFGVLLRQMKRLGMNDSDILEVMGWRDVTMLRRYIAEVAEDLAFKAHDKFSPGDNLGISRKTDGGRYAAGR